MYCIPESIPLVLVCMIVESIKSLSCPEDVGKLSNLIKYCVDLLSLLFLCSYRVGISPAASISIGGFLIGCCPARNKVMMKLEREQIEKNHREMSLRKVFQIKRTMLLMSPI